MIMTTCFELLADPTRRRVMDALLAGEQSVGSLVDRLEMNQPAVSKQLKVLREAGLASVRVDAQRRFYTDVFGMADCGDGRVAYAEPEAAMYAPEPGAAMYAPEAAAGYAPDPCAANTLGWPPSLMIWSSALPLCSIAVL